MVSGYISAERAKELKRRAPSTEPSSSKRRSTRQHHRGDEPEPESRSLRHVKPTIKFDWDEDQIDQLEAVLKQEDKDDVKRAIKAEHKEDVKRAIKTEDKDVKQATKTEDKDVKRAIKQENNKAEDNKERATSRQYMQCVLIVTKRLSNSDESSDEEDDDFRPRIPPLSVRTPTGCYIPIQGAGLSDKDKAEIASTLGPLHQVHLPGVGKTWCSRKMLEQYFYWCAERQHIFEKREAGLPPPWSEDPLFQGKSSNVFRHQDRTSQFVIKEIIDGYKCEPPMPGEVDDRWKDGVFVDTVEEACFRVMIFWQFGKMETWKGLREWLPRNDVRWATYNEKVYAAALRDHKKTGMALFTGSYQIHPHQGYGSSENFVNGLRSIKALMTGNDGLTPHDPKPPGVPKFYANQDLLEEAFQYVNRFKGVGNYHGIQLTLSLNYIPGIDLATNDWICSGRGAKNGLSLILPDLSFDDRTQLKGMKWLVDQQWQQWERLGYTPDSGLDFEALAAGRRSGIGVVDVENSLCLWQKYAREHRKRELLSRNGWLEEDPPKPTQPEGLRQGVEKQKTIIPRKYRQNQAPAVAGHRSAPSSPLTEMSSTGSQEQDAIAIAVAALDPDADPDAVAALDPDAGAALNTDAGAALDTDAGAALDTDAGAALDTDAGAALDTDAGAALDTDAVAALDPDADAAAALGAQMNVNANTPSLGNDREKTGLRVEDDSPMEVEEEAEVEEQAGNTTTGTSSPYFDAVDEPVVADDVTGGNEYCGDD